MKRGAGWPGHQRALEFAQLSLAMAPGLYMQTLQKTKAARQRTAERAAIVERTLPAEGDRLVMRGVLPLEWCPTHNVMSRGHFGQKARYAKAIRDALALQGHILHGFPRVREGVRPLVRFVRFCVQSTDGDSSFTKVPLDVLTTGKRGGGPTHLGILSDDSEAAIRLKAWQEPAPRDCQVMYLDIWEPDPEFDA